MLALDRGPYSAAMHAFAKGLPARPKAILAVSAHWQAHLPLGITTGESPGIIHDFGGFPEALYRLDYPASGDPSLAGEVADLLARADFTPVADPHRGFDHGIWTVLRHAFPNADIPVVQVTLPRVDPARLAALGQALAPLRDRNVLVFGSGGLVHNLRRVDWDAEDGAVDPWALEAEAWFMERLEGGRREELFRHRELLALSSLAAPTTEHLDPLFVALGAAAPGEALTTVFEGFQLGSLSLRSLAWG